MRGIVSLALVAALAAGMVGCGSAPSAGAGADEAAETAETATDAGAPEEQAQEGADAASRDASALDPAPEELKGVAYVKATGGRYYRFAAPHGPNVAGVTYDDVRGIAYVYGSTVASAWDASLDSSADVIDKARDYFIMTAGGHFRHAKDLTTDVAISAQRDVTISGHNMTRLEGEFVCGDRDAIPFVGYTLVEGDDVVFFIVGDDSKADRNDLTVLGVQADAVAQSVAVEED